MSFFCVIIPPVTLFSLIGNHLVLLDIHERTRELGGELIAANYNVRLGFKETIDVFKSPVRGLGVKKVGCILVSFS